MEGGKVIYRFEADDSDLKNTTMSVGNIIKGNLVSSAITTGLSKVWSGIKNITSSVTNLAVQGGFERALDIENAEHKLTGLGHSAEEVEGIMDDALKSVKNTAYGMGEAATVAASAVAAGVKPGQDLQRTLKLVGDAAAISGRSMTDMGAIFNKVAAAGKMTGEELNQLTDSGIPILQLLGETLGKTTEEVRSMVSAGEIGFDEFRDAIERGMGGAALKMGETFEGGLANTKAAMSRLGKEFMEPFLKGMTPVFGTLIKIIDQITAGTTNGLDELGNQLATQIETMVNNIIDKAIPMIENSIPVITKILNQLINAIPPILEKLLPQAISILTQIIESVVSLLPTLIPILMDGIIQVISSLATLLPTIIQAVLEGAVLIIKSLAQALPTLIPQLISAIIDSILTILDYIDVIIDAGIELLVALFEGLNDPDMIVKLVETIPMIILKLVEAIIINLPKIITATFKIIETMANSIIAALPKLKEKLPEIGNSILRELGKLPGKMAEVGGNLIRGLWNGLGSNIDWIISKIKGFGSSVMKAIKGIFGIHSPSTEFEFVGKMNMLGFEKGMEEMQPQIQDTIDSIFNLQPNVSGQMSSTYSPNVVVNVENNMELDPLGQLVSNIKTFSGGAKNDYNWGAGI